MMRKTCLAGLLACAATPALAQPGRRGKYAPLQDQPTCTRDELKAATDAYVEAQRTGDLGRLPLPTRSASWRTWRRCSARRLWNTACRSPTR